MLTTGRSWRKMIKNRGGHPRTDSKPRIPGGNGKDADIETDDNARSRARIANHQRVGGGTKRTFSEGNGGSKRVVTKDGGKVNEIRERTRFFQGQRAKIRPA